MKEIAGVPQNEFLEVAEEVMRRYLAKFGDQEADPSGGYLAVLRITDGKTLLVIRLGDLPLTPTRSFELCQEKVRRLCLTRRSHCHISSYQSRDQEAKQYGGAVAAPANSTGMSEGRKIIGSVSGLSEHGDEAVVTVIWMIFRWLMIPEAREIAKISNNPMIDPLLRACADLFDRPISGTKESETRG